jgi:hypothetical protein
MRWFPRRRKSRVKIGLMQTVTPEQAEQIRARGRLDRPDTSARDYWPMLPPTKRSG